MKNKTRLSLKGISLNDGKRFEREVHSIDKIKEFGIYAIIGENVSTANGLPEISGKNEACFCCEGHLMVTCCYSENGAQSYATYGQTLTISDRESGSTNTYTRTLSPQKNNGKWSIWQMTATGDIELITANNDILQKLTEQSNDIDDLQRTCTRMNAILSATISVSQNTAIAGNCVEITGIENCVYIMGSAQTETFDGSKTALNPKNEVNFNLTASAGTLGNIVKMDDSISSILTLPVSLVGNSTITLKATRNGTEKTETYTVAQNLRKFFAFLPTEPTTFAELEEAINTVSHFSNSVSCTVTLEPYAAMPTASDSENYNYVWFAVPAAMSISRVTQPDALNAPFGIELVKRNFVRTIVGESFNYKLYRSEVRIDARAEKRLTIN